MYVRMYVYLCIYIYICVKKNIYIYIYISISAPKQSGGPRERVQTAARRGAGQVHSPLLGMPTVSFRTHVFLSSSPYRILNITRKKGTTQEPMGKNCAFWFMACGLQSMVSGSWLRIGVSRASLGFGNAGVLGFSGLNSGFVTALGPHALFSPKMAPAPTSLPAGAPNPTQQVQTPNPDRPIGTPTKETRRGMPSSGWIVSII